ncbi:hypothetical protein B9Z46_06430 [Limnohabitans sp. Hippo4]|nr:hypothetical protein B9Z46_06430 [Limnohabitans sp. Hippo4]
MGVYMVMAFSIVTAGALTYSFLFGDFQGWRANLLLLVWVFASGLSMWAVRQGQSRGWLSWNGNVWHELPINASSFSPENVLDCGVTVHLDMQRHMLVSLYNPNGFRKWFWVSRKSFPERWHGFRCAVYSRSE